MTKRIWSLLLAIFMVFTMIPGTLQAEAEVAYTTLTANQELALKGDTLWVDLAGYDLTVSGTGNIRAFDTANECLVPNKECPQKRDKDDRFFPDSSTPVFFQQESNRDSRK